MPVTKFNKKPVYILEPYLKEIQVAMDRIVAEGYYPKLEFLWDGKSGVEIRVVAMEMLDE